jgi:hypothetical protein
MKISKESWHYKLFMKWRGLKYSSKAGYVPYRYADGISLCCYVKAVFLFAVPRIVFQSNITRLCVLNIFLSLIVYGELTSDWFMFIMMVISGVILILVAAVSIIAAMGFGSEFLTDSKTSYRVIRPYLRAKKDKVCPHIDFIEKEDI